MPLRILGQTLVVIMALGMPALAAAHINGLSLQKTVGPYVVDIGYDQAELQVGERVVFDFVLSDAAASTTPYFTDIWVRVLQNEKTIIATGIAHPQFGRTTFLMVPVEPAPLTLEVRYEREDMTLAETSFTLPVNPAPTSNATLFGAIGMCLISAALAYWLGRRKK